MPIPRASRRSATTIMAGARRRASPGARSPGADLIELPVTTVELAGRRFAAGGGGFFRLLPYRFLELGDRPGQRRPRTARRSSISTPGRSIPTSRGSPDAPLKSRLRHYTNSRRDGAQAPEIAAAITHGAGPTRSPPPSRRGWHERAQPDPALTVRRRPRADDARGSSAFVARASGRRRSSTARNGAGRSSAAPASARIIWSPSRAARCAACCRSPRSARACSATPWSRPASAPAAASSPTTSGRRRAGRRRLGARAQRSAARSSSCAAAPCPKAGTASDGVYANFARACPRDDEAICSARSRAASAPRCAGRSPPASKSRVGTRPPPPRRPLSRLCRKRAQPRHAGLPARLFEAVLDEFGDEADIVTVWNGRPPARRPCSISISTGRCQPYLGRRHRGGARLARQRPHVLRADAPRARARLHPRRFRPLQDRHRPLRAASASGVSSRTPLTYAVRTADGAAPREINPLDPKYRLKIAAWQQAAACGSPTGSARSSRGGWADAGILFLAHRIPFPPDRGDKIRSWHLLQPSRRARPSPSRRFADDAADAAHLAALREAMGGGAGRGACRVRAHRQAQLAGCARAARPAGRCRSPCSTARRCADFVERDARRPADRHGLRFLRPDGAIRARPMRGSASSWTSATSIRPSSRPMPPRRGPLALVHRREARAAARFERPIARARRRQPVRQRGRSRRCSASGGPTGADIRALSERHRSRFLRSRAPLSRRSIRARGPGR